MTVIAAYYDEGSGRAWMASDSQSEVDGVTLTSPGKVRSYGRVLLGLAGDRVWWRGVDRRASIWPTHSEAIEEWLDDLSEEVWRWARDTGRLGQDQHGVAMLPHFYLLAASPEGLWRVGAGGTVSRVAEPYAAIGCGLHYALPVLWLGHEGMLGQRGDGAGRVVTAVSAAIRFDASCGGEVVARETGREGT